MISMFFGVLFQHVLLDEIKVASLVPRRVFFEGITGKVSASFVHAIVYNMENRQLQFGLVRWRGSAHSHLYPV